MAKKDEVSFSYDNLKILGGIGSKVYVQGEIYLERTGTISPEAILVVPKAVFKRTLDLWLKDKQDYCERFQHFCGDMGSLRSTDYVESSEEKRLSLSKYELVEGCWKWVYPKVRTFEIRSFLDSTDMEHG